VTLRFSIRDLLWLTAVVAICLASLFYGYPREALRHRLARLSKGMTVAEVELALNLRLTWVDVDSNHSSYYFLALPSLRQSYVSHPAEYLTLAFLGNPRRFSGATLFAQNGSREEWPK
jgi:hypothetical protein